ncbi:MAG: cyclic nucleotide-binding domain-containing protein [Gallionella sp.]|nr:cyclic nucleotide-binding domain-containing protein [Gallionella sp.]
MPSEDIIAHALTNEDFVRIKSLGTPQTYKHGELIFSDGDNADHIYFIESGSVSIFIEKFTFQEEISALGPGEYFGEMAFFSGDRRSASATALVDTTLLSVGKDAFLNFYEANQDVAAKINDVFSRRNNELSFKEHLTGSNIGIKGDPSLRFSAFSRERYDSVVDKIIFDLQPRLYDLLMNRSAYEIFIHCNSGEIHIRTVFDPFNGDIHPASKLLNIAYIERHFPVIGYGEKSAMIKHLYETIGKQTAFTHLPEQIKAGLQAGFGEWQPVEQSKIADTISKLSLLRKIENFYLRNFSISTIRDTIRMQFNCDGTQIVDAQGFQDFLEQNLDMDEIYDFNAGERRAAPRRTPGQQMARSKFQLGERRSPPGRREKDWAVLTGKE